MVRNSLRSDVRPVATWALIAVNVAVFLWGAWLAAHSYAEQRRFGSAVYMPLADGAIYRVVMTQSGLNAEAVNPIAENAVRRGI